MDWRSIVGAIAPTLATGLAGPLGGLVASIAGRVLLGDDRAAPGDVRDYVLANQTPETFAKLKQVEAEVGVRLRELEIELDRISADDRDSARRREMAVRGMAPGLLATVVVVGFFGVLGTLVSGLAAMPADYEMLVGGLIGALAAALTQVLNYYFGSSSSSAQKNAILDRLAGGR